MKKIVIAFCVFCIIISVYLNSFASSMYQNNNLSSINIYTSKLIVNPNEEIELNIEFGEKLTEFSILVLYDKNLVEYINTTNGSVIDKGNSIEINFLNENNAIENLKIVFKAKEDIITSNPTNFAITATNLKSEVLSQKYYDINVPIIKNFVVEPIYTNYNIDLKYEGDIFENQEKDMSIIINSDMAKPYDHARIVLEVIKDDSATVQLFGIDENGLTHELIQSGWGDTSGYQLGGKDIKKQLDLIGNFSKSGRYSITVKIIDRDNSDTVISKETFDIIVKSNLTLDNEVNDKELLNNTQNEISAIEQNNISNTISKDNKLLRTGSDGILKMMLFTVVIIFGYIYLESKKNK